MGNASSVSAQNGRKARRSTRLNEVFGFLHGGRVREEVGILTMCVQSGWRARDFVSSGHGYGRVRIRESAALLIDEIICLYLIDISRCDRRNRLDDNRVLLGTRATSSRYRVKSRKPSPRPRRFVTKITRIIATL